MKRCVAHDSPARDIAERRWNLCRTHRRAVGERHVSIEAVDPHRVVGRDGIDPRALRQLAAPVLMIPVAARDPGSGLHRHGKSLDARDEFRWRARVPQLDGSEVHPAAQEMHVGVYESGSYHPAMRVDDSRSRIGQSSDLRVRSDRCDPIATQRYGVGPWLRRLARPDDSIDDGDRNRLLPGCHGSGAALENCSGQESEASERRPENAQSQFRLPKILLGERALAEYFPIAVLNPGVEP